MSTGKRLARVPGISQAPGKPGMLFPEGNPGFKRLGMRAVSPGWTPGATSGNSVDASGDEEEPEFPVCGEGWELWGAEMNSGQNPGNVQGWILME